MRPQGGITESTHLTENQDFSGVAGTHVAKVLKDPFAWQHEGSHYRLTVVDGLIRFEQQLRGGTWYMIEPNHDCLALMSALKRLLNRLGRAEARIAHILAGRDDR